MVYEQFVVGLQHQVSYPSRIPAANKADEAFPESWMSCRTKHQLGYLICFIRVQAGGRGVRGYQESEKLTAIPSILARVLGSRDGVRHKARQKVAIDMKTNPFRFDAVAM